MLGLANACKGRVYARMMTSIYATDTPLVWHFVEAMSHEEPLVFLCISRLELRRLIVRGCLVGIEHFESRKPAFWRVRGRIIYL